MSDQVYERELRSKIMSLVGVSRWSVRCERAMEWFLEHRNELLHIDDYRRHSTEDESYISRHPNGNKQAHRYGIEVGVDTYKNKRFYVYLVREVFEGKEEMQVS